MASALGHLAVGAAIGFAASAPGNRRASTWRCAFIACLPDADYLIEPHVAADSLWRHRGLTHSFIVQAAAVAVCAALIATLRCGGARHAALAWLLALWSHSLLDSMTDGEPGVAMWAPIDATRSFLPWRPIPVSPDAIGPFLNDWGVRVLRIEVMFALVAWAAALGVARARRSRARPGMVSCA